MERYRDEKKQRDEDGQYPRNSRSKEFNNEDTSRPRERFRSFDKVDERNPRNGYQKDLLEAKPRARSNDTVFDRQASYGARSEQSREFKKVKDFERRERDDKTVGDHKKKYEKGAPKIRYEAPPSTPYTTAGSEFIYGTFAVRSAIQAGRRKLYKLYIYHPETPEKTKSKDSVPTESEEAQVRKFAMVAGVKVVEVAGSDWLQLFDSMAGGRPHNNLVLETSSLPKLPVSELKAVESETAKVVAIPSTQSEEDAIINEDAFKINDDGSVTIPSPEADNQTVRYPLFLFLDKVQDTGNFGAILRSAYFFGVTGVIVPDHGTAPMSAITVKSSAGAAEMVPILTTKHEVEFLGKCYNNGWNIIAATAPDANDSKKKAIDFLKSSRKRPSLNREEIGTVLKQGPAILMLGNEGIGLRPKLENMARSTVAIRGLTRRDEFAAGVVDSLNVSVAAGVLLQQFLSPVETSKDSFLASAEPALETSSTALPIANEDTEINAEQQEAKIF